jgi:hypothetical protein
MDQGSIGDVENIRFKNSYVCVPQSNFELGCLLENSRGINHITTINNNITIATLLINNKNG